MPSHEMRRLKQLEDVNAALRKFVAHPSGDPRIGGRAKLTSGLRQKAANLGGLTTHANLAGSPRPNGDR